MDSFFVILLLLTIFAFFIPAYLFYVKVLGSLSYLRKNLEEIKILKE